MKIVSWNVNGLRAIAKKGFGEWLTDCGADIVCVQEVRAHSHQIPLELREVSGWHSHFVSAARAGYSGVGVYSRHPLDEVTSSLGADEFDAEGRLQMARVGRLLVVNGYFPNGNGKERDNSRIPYKLAFYQRLHALLEEQRARGEAIVVLGDFNTAHREIDLARPKQNETTSGFCPEEREELDRWIRTGWVDTFRHFNSEPGHYSWWSSRFGVREKNIGWRIDYVLASPGAVPHLKDAFIWPHVKGSDHCPVGIELDPKILR